jgi:hypothetical protein
MRWSGTVVLCFTAWAYACTRLEGAEDTFGDGKAGSSSTNAGASSLGGEPTSGGGGEPGVGGQSDLAGNTGDGGEPTGEKCPPVGERELEELGTSGEVTLTTDTRWTCQFDYQLASNLFVAPGATLTVDPGVVVRLAKNTMLLVQRGGQLDAAGTVDSPIVFTSSQAPGERDAGDHRGLILIGDGPSQSTTQPVYDSVSGARAHYGGGQAGDPLGSCGRLEFVRIEFGGGSTDDVSLPAGALTLAGCGSGTTIDHVQIHRATDGLGILGGTVNVRHALVSGTQLGEAVEWSAGYTGTMQYIVAQTLGASAAMQGSNSAEDPEASPVSRPTIYNATLVGIYDEASGRSPPVTTQHFGFNLQLGSHAVLKNSIVVGFAEAGFDWDLDLAASNTLVGTGKPIDISHVLLFGNKAPYSSQAQSLSTMPSMRLQNPGLPNAADPSETAPTAAPVFSPLDPTVNIDPTPSPSGFDATAGYRGAVPQDGLDWTKGWASYPVD